MNISTDQALHMVAGGYGKTGNNDDKVEKR